MCLMCIIQGKRVLLDFQKNLKTLKNWKYRLVSSTMVAIGRLKSIVAYVKQQRTFITFVETIHILQV